MIIFFRTFGGFARDKQVKEEHNKLVASLSEEDKSSVKPDGPYYFAGYDAPFKPLFRHNEIWVLLSNKIDHVDNLPHPKL